MKYRRTMSRPLAGPLLASPLFAFAALLTITAGTGRAEPPQATTRPAGFLQGERKEVPDDFFVELEQSRLRLKLQDFGLEDAQQGLEDSLVTLITPSGARQQPPSDAQGNVAFENVDEGPLGIVVTGPDQHATVAVYARPLGRAPAAGESAEDGADAQAEPADEPLVAAANPFRLPVMRIGASEVLKNTAGYTPQAAPTKSFSSEQYAGFLRYNSVPTLYYRVRMQADGRVPGKVFTMVDPDLPLDYSGTNVTVYRAGEYIQSTPTTPEGFFEVTGIRPGVYGVVAAGPLGYAAFAFEVVPSGDGPLPEPNVAATKAAPTIRTVAFRDGEVAADGVSDILFVPLIPPAMLDTLRRTLLEAYSPFLGGGDGGFAAGTPFGGGPFGGGGFGGGGFGGGGFGGGGGGGGGLGGGGLLGVAGLAAGLAALGDDDGGVVPPGVTSPFLPELPAIILPPMNPPDDGFDDGFDYDPPGGGGVTPPDVAF
ncbi:hypothetical protein [Roseimaritima sediminicola]|uniref:hypothetical protein n=1 Tax=Roseimaritima sediminicola TaxID=2662066 RepID=UPI00129846DE|nr:hypothetical protein [Roseimaritima sediminicola]